MEVLELSELVDFMPGEVIFKEGDSGDFMYIIRSGEVEVIKQITGKPVVITRLGPDHIFGEMALVERRLRSATVRAVTGVSCQLIGGEIFRKRWAEVPAWMQDLYGLVIERLRITTRKYNPHAGRIPGFQIVDLLSMIVHELRTPASATVTVSWNTVLDRMRYMFDLPDAQVRMIMDLLVESTLISSEFDDSSGNRQLMVESDRITEFVKFVKGWRLSRAGDEFPDSDEKGGEYEFLSLLKRIFADQSGLHAAAVEDIAERLNIRLGKSLGAFKEVISSLSETGIWNLGGDDSVEIDLDVLAERLTTLQAEHEFPWLAMRISGLSREIADFQLPPRSKSSTATIVEGLTGH